MESEPITNLKPTPTPRGAVLQTTAREILLNPRDLELGPPIARGGSGVVRRGRLYGAVPVAAKSLYSQFMMGDLEEAIGACVRACVRACVKFYFVRACVRAYARVRAGLI